MMGLKQTIFQSGDLPSNLVFIKTRVQLSHLLFVVVWLQAFCYPLPPRGIEVTGVYLFSELCGRT